MATCGTCGGSGSITVSSICQMCSGTGEIISYDDDGIEIMVHCSNCEYGMIYTEQACRTCGGTGAV